MASETLNLGEKLGGYRSIPERIQAVLCLGGLGMFVALWFLGNAANFFVLIPVTIAAIAALYAAFHFLPALRSSLRIFEQGIELEIQGKSRSFRFAELTSLEAKFTDHHYKHAYIGTAAKLEFYVEGRHLPYTYECDFRRGGRGEKWVMLALQLCSQAIEQRLLVELEQKGSIRWRDNVSLTDEGILITDPGGASRLVAYLAISDWKVVDNDLKIWKADDALPWLVFHNDSPNFIPLYNLFQSLAQAARNIGSPANEPQLAAHA